jgi:hypothetical protein
LLLISASWVARITEVSCQCPATLFWSGGNLGHWSPFSTSYLMCSAFRSNIFNFCSFCGFLIILRAYLVIILIKVKYIQFLSENKKNVIEEWEMGVEKNWGKIFFVQIHGETVDQTSRLLKMWDHSKWKPLQLIFLDKGVKVLLMKLQVFYNCSRFKNLIKLGCINT